MVNVAVVELVSPHSSVAVNVTVIASVHPLEVHVPGVLEIVAVPQISEAVAPALLASQAK